MRGKLRHIRGILLLGMILATLPFGVALAVCPPGVQSCSDSYQVDQTFFGSGGQVEACSSQYCSRQSLGELTIGETNSMNYRAYAGFNTTDEPYLEFVVTGANIDIGFLSTDQPTTTTGQFYVRAWQAHGYAITTQSDPPSNSAFGHQIAPLTTPGASVAGQEQFGINLVSNSSPSVGTNPSQIHDFSFGAPAPGYGTSNTFTYNKGDTVASSTQSSGVTMYTVSYLYNISDSTPSGRYIFTHNLVATGTY